jgi:hypothetical protein
LFHKPIPALTGIFPVLLPSLWILTCQVPAVGVAVALPEKAEIKLPQKQNTNINNQKGEAPRFSMTLP